MPRNKKLIVLHSKGCNIYKGEKKEKRIGQAREREFFSDSKTLMNKDSVFLFQFQYYFSDVGEKREERTAYDSTFWNRVCFLMWQL